MTSAFSKPSHFVFFLFLLFSTPPSALSIPPLPSGDIDLLEFPLNLEYLEAEFFLWGALGYGLDHIAPNLTVDGPPPIGVRKANLDPFIRDIVTQFAYQEVGHLKAIKQRVEGFPRPLLDLSPAKFADVINSALGRTLHPPFDPYANGLNYLLASYIIPYVGLTGYVGANPKLQSPITKRVHTYFLSGTFTRRGIEHELRSFQPCSPLSIKLRGGIGLRDSLFGRLALTYEHINQYFFIMFLKYRNTSNLIFAIFIIIIIIILALMMTSNRS